MEKKLYRNEHDKMVAGVSSGLAEYMQVEVTIIRLLFALSTVFMAGAGMVVYIIMWIIVPVNNDPKARFSKFNQYFGDKNTAPFTKSDVEEAEIVGEKKATESNWTSSFGGSTQFENQGAQNFSGFSKPNNQTGRLVGGLFLLVFGCYFLMNEFHFIPYWFRIGKLWPLIFVAVGLSIILKSQKKSDFEKWKEQQNDAAKTDTQAMPKEEGKAESGDKEA